MSVVMTIAMALTGAGSTAQVMPTQYVAGHFYATPQTASGQTLRLIVDTGGGGVGTLYWLTDDSARKLHLPPATCKGDGHTLKVAVAPAYQKQAALPPALGSCAGKLAVFPEKMDYDGMIGSNYLGGRIWTFDYPHQVLRLESSGWRHDTAAKSSNLGFQKDDTGGVTGYFPRIVMRVDGIPINMLLDTGATAHPTAAGKAATGLETEANGQGVASYITTRMFNIWHRKHPDWRVVDNGDNLQGPTRLIEVPKVQVAGWVVGPMWFTERPDKAFHKRMARLMDETPEGALGGNVLSHFSMTLDYVHAKAWFSCAQACEAAPAGR
ncbi:hypothetical protein [Dyella sp.]|uniref:hypothetical protein n=1 Tax=Dyella sp. TaxID=1869338 RepID=UPI002ED08419